MAEDTRIPFSRAAGWAGSLADKPVVLCSVVFFVGPYKVLSLTRDPMTGSPPFPCSLSHTALSLGFLSKLGLRLVEYPKNYRSIQVQEVVFLPQVAAASRQRRFTALACFFI